MLKDANNKWYAPNDKNHDGIPDRASLADNAEKLGDQLPEYYATAESVVHITNGTTTVGKAAKDSDGNNIVNTYATKKELTEIDTLVNEIVTTNLNAIIDGTKKVAKAASADTAAACTGNSATATKATQDGSGNTITSYYATLSTAQTISGNKTFSGNAYFANGTTYYVNSSGAAKFASVTSAGAVSGTTATFSGVTKVTNTTAASSTSTGALIVSGGIGCAGNIYGSQVYGAVYNDYAERRKSQCEIKPGYVVTEIGDDYVIKCTSDKNSTAMIVSDTYGFLIGEDEGRFYSTPVGLSGRVLAYVSKYSKPLTIGDAVCSAKDGKIRKMSKLEKILHP